MEKIRVMLDVGGTQIKGGVMAADGSLLGEVHSTDAHARDDKEAIFTALGSMIRTLRNEHPQAQLAGVGMAFPDPFDYDTGVCLIRGLNKYEAIYGLNLGEELKARMPELQDVPFAYMHDAESFAVGESYLGEARNDNRILCICIGTGCGSTFVENHRALKGDSEGVPATGMIYGLPYKESIVDDYLSARGLARVAQRVTGEALTGKELYDRCQAGDEKALQTFREFGEDLVACLLPHVEAFHPDAVVMGGQIAKSFDLFGGAFAEACAQRHVKIYKEYETSVRAMQGVFSKMTAAAAD